MGMMGAGAGLSSLAGGRGGGNNSGIKPPVSSQELGMAGMNSASHSMGRMSNGSQPMAFGNDGITNQSSSAIQQTPMSFGEKFKVGMKGAVYGAGTGFAAGSLQSAAHVMHMYQAVRPMVHDIQGTGLSKAFEAGQIGQANHSLRDIDTSMTNMESPNINIETTQAMMPETDEKGMMVTNPGEAVNSMENLDRAHNRFGTLEGQQEYLRTMRNNVPHFESLKPEIQNQVDQRLTEQLEKHPFSAEKIVDAAQGRQGVTLKNRM